MSANAGDAAMDGASQGAGVPSLVHEPFTLAERMQQLSEIDSVHALRLLHYRNGPPS